MTTHTLVHNIAGDVVGVEPQSKCRHERTEGDCAYCRECNENEQEG